MLNQFPAVIKQAHERIIGGGNLPNEDKIFSLYDPDVQVIVRGKILHIRQANQPEEELRNI